MPSHAIAAFQHVNGKKVLSDSLMVNGSSAQSLVGGQPQPQQGGGGGGGGGGVSSISENSKFILDLTCNSNEDFEFMDSPRNSGGAMSLKTLESKKGSASTIVKSEYMDPTAGASAEYGSLNNINLVKAR
jgi:hypothetical protein